MFHILVDVAFDKIIVVVVDQCQMALVFNTLEEERADEKREMEDVNGNVNRLIFNM